MFAEPGLNSRLDSLQAAFLRVKLKALERWNRRRAAIAEVYLDGLSRIIDMVLPRRRGETCPSGTCSAYATRRDGLARHLATRCLTQIHYPVPPHRSDAFGHLGLPSDAFPVTNAAAATLLSLPMGPHLGDADVQE